MLTCIAECQCRPHHSFSACLVTGMGDPVRVRDVYPYLCSGRLCMYPIKIQGILTLPVEVAVHQRSSLGLEARKTVEAASELRTSSTYCYNCRCKLHPGPNDFEFRAACIGLSPTRAIADLFAHLSHSCCCAQRKLCPESTDSFLIYWNRNSSTISI